MHSRTYANKVISVLFNPQERIHTCHGGPTRLFYLGHLRIKREKRDTCPIRSFLPRLNHFGDGFYQPPTRTEKRARDPRSTTAPAAASKWPATQMSPSRSQVKACGSRPRATVATFANSHLGVARISCIPPSHARLCYGGVQPWEAAKCRSIRLGFTKFNSVSH